MLVSIYMYIWWCAKMFTNFSWKCCIYCPARLCCPQTSVFNPFINFPGCGIIPDTDIWFWTYSDCFGVVSSYWEVVLKVRNWDHFGVLTIVSALEEKFWLFRPEARSREPWAMRDVTRAVCVGLTASIWSHPRTACPLELCNVRNWTVLVLLTVLTEQQ